MAPKLAGGGFKRRSENSKYLVITRFKEQLASLMPIMNQSWTPDALHPVHTSCGTD